jgi:hypothetical protein
LKNHDECISITNAISQNSTPSYVQGFIAELLDGRQALVVDVVLQQDLQLAKTVGNPKIK